MRESERGQRYVIYDDFLTKEDRDQALKLMDRSGLTDTQSVISPALDGPARRSRGMSFTASIGDNPDSARPSVFTKIAQAVCDESRLLGTPSTDWDNVTFTFWQYPAGSRLGWHNDAGGGRQGEFIYYLHPHWDISWGGELMLIDRDPKTLSNPAHTAARGQEATSPDAMLRNILRDCEVSPVAILPRPNRLVIVKANTIHTVRRVDHTAGDNTRRTLTGFVYHSGAFQANLTRGREAARRALAPDAVR